MLVEIYIYIYIYPTACGKPATVPTHVDRSIARSIDRSIARWRFPRRSRIDEKSWKLIQESSRNRPRIERKKTKIIKNRSSETLRGAQGTPGRKLMKNRKKSDYAGPPRGPVLGHLGDIGHHLADIFSILGWKVDGPFDDRRFDGRSVRKWTAKCG